jgi:uncharacterized protein YjbI with pentapeptide repeats
MSEAENELVIAEQEFVGKTFSYVRDGSVYMNCIFRDTRWINVSLQHVRFVNCHFENMFCSAMRGTNTHWDACEMRNLEWQKVDIRQSHIMDSVVTDWHVDASRLMHVCLTNTKVSRWRFSDCQLQHLTLMGCSVQSLSQTICLASDMSWIDSKIADAKLERCKLERLIAAQMDISSLSLVRCAGTQVRTIQSKLLNAIYDDNELDGASWSHSELHDCQFVNCKLPLAGFDHASLSCTTFDFVEMHRSLFDYANIKTSTFKHVRAPQASFRNARMTDVLIHQANLSELDACGFHADHLKLENVDCQRAKLIGQDQQVWNAAKLQGAKFEVPKNLDDRVWWLTVRPGHREALS